MILRSVSGRLFGAAALLVVAGLSLCTFVIPWHPAGPSQYLGFDPNLMYTDAAAGQVSMDATKLGLRASNASISDVHLVTSVSAFSTAMDISIAGGTLDTNWHNVTANVTAPPEARYMSLIVGTVDSIAVFTYLTVS